MQEDFISNNNSLSKLRVPILTGIIFLFFAFFIAHWFGLYEKYYFFDNIVHFFAGSIVAFFCATYLKTELKHTSLFKGILIILGFTCFVGVTWEFLEFVSNTFSPTYAPSLYPYFHIGDLADTLNDLALDILGGCTFIILWVMKK